MRHKFSEVFLNSKAKLLERDMTETLAKSLILFGVLLTLVGAVLYFARCSDLNFFQWFGNLPLDFKVERENFKFYFPLGTSIVLSIVLSLLFYFFRKLSE